jgi:hypothetical protein
MTTTTVEQDDRDMSRDKCCEKYETCTVDCIQRLHWHDERRSSIEVAAKQAEIDRLMLEYCPDEMTQEQIENWKRSQSPVKNAAPRVTEAEATHQESSLPGGPVVAAPPE